MEDVQSQTEDQITLLDKEDERNLKKRSSIWTADYGSLLTAITNQTDDFLSELAGLPKDDFEVFM